MGISSTKGLFYLLKRLVCFALLFMTSWSSHPYPVVHLVITVCYFCVLFHAILPTFSPTCPADPGHLSGERPILPDQKTMLFLGPFRALLWPSLGTCRRFVSSGMLFLTPFLGHFPLFYPCHNRKLAVLDTPFSTAYCDHWGFLVLLPLRPVLRGHFPIKKGHFPIKNGIFLCRGRQKYGF